MRHSDFDAVQAERIELQGAMKTFAGNVFSDSMPASFSLYDATSEADGAICRCMRRGPR